ncbi:MAG: LPS assembly lipoprotein LptE [Comamonas sp.]
MRKRTLLSLMALAPVVSACGFRLRGAPSFPFSTLYVQAPDGSPFTREVLRNLATAGGNLTVVLPPAKADTAEVTLFLLGERRQRVILAKTVSGQVREVELRLFARFKLVDKEGRVWIEDTEMQQKREMSYSESLALAKDEEEATLYRNMYSDLAQQLLRRLAAAHAPAAD